MKVAPWKFALRRRAVSKLVSVMVALLKLASSRLRARKRRLLIVVSGIVRAGAKESTM